MTTNATPAVGHLKDAASDLPDPREAALEALRRLGAQLPPAPDGAPSFTPTSPLSGHGLFPLPVTLPEEVGAAVDRAHEAFLTWRLVPAPARGALVRRFGDLLREHKADLATLVTLEAGKITAEALGEVQEMFDICDLAVGLSRQLEGRTMPSERPGHRLMETWHPLGVVGVISAFNFPAAVWSWNTAVALVCGDPVVWKPSETAPLTALGAAALLRRAAAELGAPEHLATVILGGRETGEALVAHPRVALLSATGSERMGAEVAPVVAARMGRTLLELGGNNAAIVTPSADLDLTVRGVVFSAVGTAGQRCTSLRRLIVHTSVVDEVLERLASAYRGLPIGDPREAGTLVGPLVSAAARDRMLAALEQARAEGGTVVTGGEAHALPAAPDAAYVTPALVQMPAQSPIVHTETFAPILYVLGYSDLDEAIAMHNAVPQGLSSSIFTLDQREAERFLGPDGSDCGIANVNIGTSGAEIGGAFGGEKSTGGGRESGSDAWRAYMRRATNTINYSADLPLAQGVDFG
ncbi:aldehyde dehydrogenase family protein [Occultella glacieicola]|uniref:aldehyde dehydrogenase (NAD(+)) n=1 Tax=Occultella glacieicola TaxID=2518684 RepID=A0ABY2E4P5_9MICO|nr:aldehyde dehydrogenase family protein [Occultella glacieicola]TDE94861.1 aldehyde dehydrogenase family protein [Occultella glacieicola]